MAYHRDSAFPHFLPTSRRNCTDNVINPNENRRLPLPPARSHLLSRLSRTEPAVTHTWDAGSAPTSSPPSPSSQVTFPDAALRGSCRHCLCPLLGQLWGKARPHRGGDSNLLRGSRAPATSPPLRSAESALRRDPFLRRGWKRCCAGAAARAAGLENIYLRMRMGERRFWELIWTGNFDLFFSARGEVICWWRVSAWAGRYFGLEGSIICQANTLLELKDWNSNEIYSNWEQWNTSFGL